MQENPPRNDRGDIVEGTRESKTRKSVYISFDASCQRFSLAAIMDTLLVAQKG